MVQNFFRKPIHGIGKWVQILCKSDSSTIVGFVGQNWLDQVWTELHSDLLKDFLDSYRTLSAN